MKLVLTESLKIVRPGKITKEERLDDLENGEAGAQLNSEE